MRVMHVTFDMRIGGTEMVIKNIIEGNSDANIEMSIYCIEAPLGPWGEDLKASGTPIAVEERQPGFDRSLISKIRKHIKDNDIDILHCHQYTPWVYGALAAAFTKTKVIFTEHGRFYPDSSSWKRKLINPCLLALTSRITAISQATKLALEEFEFIPNEKIEVVYNGISPIQPELDEVKRIRHALRLKEDTLVFGSIARFDPIKNQSMMLAAFAEAEKSLENIHLILVGDGELRDVLEQLAVKLGITEKVTFTGYIPKPFNYLAAMDVFLLSSLSEGTSMTLLEAMSLGKPCVVTDAGGNPEIIKHEVNGLVVENDNYTAFAEAMLALASKNKHSMRLAAHDRFNNLFDVSVMSKKYNTIYKTLA